MIKALSKLHIKLFGILFFLFLKGYCFQEEANSVPDCTKLSNPLNEAIDVPVDTNLTWNEVEDVIGYLIFVRTTEEENVYALYSAKNALTYDLPFNLPEFTQIYVRIYPYNSEGDAVGCIEETFRTGGSLLPPTCTTLTNPLANTVNVPVNTNISWNEVTNAIGYQITIQDGNGLNESFSVEKETNYNLPFSLSQDRHINVLIIPFNSIGQALGCISESFKTEKKMVLSIPKFFTPNGDSYNDFWIVQNQSNKVCCISIYNQYGKLLKNITNLNNGWDGTYMGNLMPSGDYWYAVKYKSGEILKGHFSLIR